MENPYASLLEEKKVALKEDQENYFVITERHLQILWLEQLALNEVLELEGKPLRILSPGIWNLESGPDFKSAHFLWGDKELKGDVELHLFPSSWEQHGHHKDPKYTSVVLHVSLYKLFKEVECYTLQGLRLPLLTLEHCFQRPLKDLVQSIDLQEYPYKRSRGVGRCSEEVFTKFSNKEEKEFFSWAALWRLEEKAKRIDANFSKEEAFWGACIQVLGYKKNTRVFSALFIELKDKLDKSEDELLAYCMGRCDLFGDFFFKKWRKNLFYQKLFSIWEKDKSFLVPLSLSLGNVRPANHPIRRFVLMIKWLKKGEQDPLQGKKEWKKKDLESLFPSPKDSYWNVNFLFKEKESTKKLSLSLLGSNLRKELIVNVVLPILWNRHESNIEYKNYILHLYSQFPSSDTGKFRFLWQRFKGEIFACETNREALVEQGMYQIHNDFCVHHEASCEGCPFIDRFTKKAGSFL